MVADALAGAQRQWTCRDGGAAVLLWLLLAGCGSSDETRHPGSGAGHTTGTGGSGGGGAGAIGGGGGSGGGGGVACDDGSCAEQWPMLPAARAYIGPGGIDHADCTGGTRDAPWATWTEPRKNGCIAPGDAIYLMAGTYEFDGGVFADDALDGHINISGEDGQVTYLAADPEATGPWPVKLHGKFGFFGSHAEIRGLEFESNGAPGVDGYPAAVFGSHVTFRGNYIHGRPQDFGVPGVSYDCLKISGIDYASGIARTEGVRVIDNEIGTCPEDCVDIAGPGKDLVYRGNHVFGCHSGLMAKGGVEGVLIERNRVHDVALGINGFGGNCNSSPCVLNTFVTGIPVEDRFMAKDVTVRNNVLYAITSNAIEGRGWRNVRIYHNTIFGVGESAIRVGGAMWEYEDELANEYCQANPNACEQPCQVAGLVDCWRVWIAPRDVELGNNVVVDARWQIIAARDSLVGLSASTNVYFNETRALDFVLVEDFVVNGIPDETFSLASFPYEHGSFDEDPGLADPSGNDFSLNETAFARDKGTPLGVPCDFDRRPRCDAPDIGAYEVARP